jgi:hypothetical protein
MCAPPLKRLLVLLGLAGAKKCEKSVLNGALKWGYSRAMKMGGLAVQPWSMFAIQIVFSGIFICNLLLDFLKSGLGTLI